MATNWQAKRSFEETNWHMLEDTMLCDVTFLVGSDKKEIKAHRFMLASRSPVFYAMFCGGLPETSGRVEITDIETDTMDMLLRFIYTEDCVVTGESVMRLIYAAKKYDIKRLLQKCHTFLSEQIYTDTVCDIFTQMHAFDERQLKEECFKFILANGKEVLQTEGFAKLPRELLREILETDVIEATEDDIYDGCKQWANHQMVSSDANLDISDSDIPARDILGDLLYLIRFPTMSQKYFTSSCSKDNILTSDEKVSIFQFIFSGAKDGNLKFDVKRRDKVFQEKLIISRLQSEKTNQHNYSGKCPDAIDFIVSKRVMLWGVGGVHANRSRGGYRKRPVIES